MLELAVLLKEGTYALRSGYSKLSKDPAQAEGDAQPRASPSVVLKVYRRALGNLFREEGYVKKLEDRDTETKVTAINLVIEIFKRREVYRHLSNAADRLARAGEVLHDIVVKIS